MYDYEKNWWETKNHQKIKIEDMQTSHIKNTINYLKRHKDFYDVAYGGIFDVDTFDYEDNSELVDRKIEELQHELNRRKK